MTIDKPKAPRKTPARLSLADQLAHDYCMAVLHSTATFEMLDAADGVHTDRLVYLGREYARKMLGSAA
jgi:hypothetical protein